MATLRDVKRKINSIRSTQTITRTMRMISASKLRRAQEELGKVSAYALRMEDVLKRMAGSVPEQSNPLLVEREEVRKVLLFAIASDRGLAGAFNLNVANTVETFVREHKATYEKIDVSVVGRKMRDYLKRRNIAIAKERVDVKALDREVAEEMAREAADAYLSGEYDKVYLIYTHFHSAVNQKVEMQEFLPLKPAKGEEGLDYLYEPDVQSIVDRFIPRYLFTKVYFALAESQTSEHASRMAAMENATSNCGDMINHLTLVYNKTRQQSITNEMMDIVGGAEALQGEA